MCSNSCPYSIGSMFPAGFPDFTWMDTWPQAIPLKMSAVTNARRRFIPF